METRSNTTYQTMKTVTSSKGSQRGLTDIEIDGFEGHLNIGYIGSSSDDLRKSQIGYITSSDLGITPNTTSVTNSDLHLKISSDDTLISSGFHEESELSETENSKAMYAKTSAVFIADRDTTSTLPLRPSKFFNDPLFPSVQTPLEDLFSNERASTPSENSKKWIPWSDQVWIDTTDGNTDAISNITDHVTEHNVPENITESRYSCLPTALPASSPAVNCMTLSQQFVIPGHSNKLMKENIGPETLQVRNATRINAAFYSSPSSQM